LHAVLKIKYIIFKSIVLCKYGNGNPYNGVHWRMPVSASLFLQ